MLIEEELLAYLESSMREGENKARDKKIIAFYYGFGDVAWPTLEQVAVTFGLNERERVRQIVKNKFQSQVTIETLPRAARLAELIERFDFVSSETLYRLLAEERLAPADASLRGLLNLLEDLGLCLDFDLYDPLLRPEARAVADSDEKSFLVRTSYLPSIKKALKAARNLPGLLGLAREAYLKSALPNATDQTRAQVLELLRASPDCCHVNVDGENWYCVEGRDNTLVNSCEKIFGVIGSCESAVLAEVLANSLNRRTGRFEYPDARVIERFLYASGFFDAQGSRLSFRGVTTGLTDIETEAVAFLIEKGVVSYPIIKTHLSGKGYGDPSIVKVSTASPLVYVDKSAGRYHYTYQLIPAAAPKIASTDGERYVAIRSRLEKLFELGTDVSVQSTRRREQGILQDWLFDGQETANCGICDRTFSARALVAAHKKKRTLCSDKERLDPYVVMPMCVFGCDHLYESGAIVISKGAISAGRAPLQSTHEAEFAASLMGRRIAEKWLRGDPRYFEPSNPNTKTSTTPETEQ